MTSHLPTIHPWSAESCGSGLAALGTTLFSPVGTTVWPAANKAYYLPFQVLSPITVSKLWVFNGNVVSGNIDVGIYDRTGTQLVSAGSTTQTGTSVIQTFDITDFLLDVGQFYLALVLNNGTGKVYSTAVSPDYLAILGLKQQTTAFPLPATATFARCATDSFLPVFGILLSPRTVI